MAQPIEQLLASTAFNPGWTEGIGNNKFRDYFKGILLSSSFAKNLALDNDEALHMIITAKGIYQDPAEEQEEVDDIATALPEIRRALSLFCYRSVSLTLPQAIKRLFRPRENRRRMEQSLRNTFPSKVVYMKPSMMDDAHPTLHFQQLRRQSRYSTLSLRNSTGSLTTLLSNQRTKLSY